MLLILQMCFPRMEEGADMHSLLMTDNNTLLMGGLQNYAVEVDLNTVQETQKVIHSATSASYMQRWPRWHEITQVQVTRVKLSCVSKTVQCWDSWVGDNASKQSLLLLRSHFWQGKEDWMTWVSRSKTCLWLTQALAAFWKTGNSSGLAHLQDGARVWRILWEPLRLWRSWKSPGRLWVLQPRSKRSGLWPIPHGVWPPHDASCNAAAGARGPTFLALHTYLHIAPGNHLTDRYQLEKKVSAFGVSSADLHFRFIS